MKKYILLPALLIAILFTSCTKDQIDPIQDTPEKAEARLAINTLSNSFLVSTWTITTCIINTTDIAPTYKEYCLAFATNGSLIIKDAASANVAGKWVVSYVDGKTRVSFTFLNNSGFEPMNGSWTMLDGSTDTKVVMQSVTQQKNYLTIEQQ